MPYNLSQFQTDFQTSGLSMVFDKLICALTLILRKPELFKIMDTLEIVRRSVPRVWFAILAPGERDARMRKFGPCSQGASW